MYKSYVHTKTEKIYSKSYSQFSFAIELYGTDFFLNIIPLLSSDYKQITFAPKTAVQCRNINCLLIINYRTKLYF